MDVSTYELVRMCTCTKKKRRIRRRKEGMKNLLEKRKRRIIIPVPLEKAGKHGGNGTGKKPPARTPSRLVFSLSRQRSSNKKAASAKAQKEATSVAPLLPFPSSLSYPFVVAFIGTSVLLTLTKDESYVSFLL